LTDGYRLITLNSFNGLLMLNLPTNTSVSIAKKESLPNKVVLENFRGLFNLICQKALDKGTVSIYDSRNY